MKKNSAQAFLTDVLIEKIGALKESGLTLKLIGKEISVPHGTIRAWLRAGSLGFDSSGYDLGPNDPRRKLSKRVNYKSRTSYTESDKSKIKAKNIVRVRASSKQMYKDRKHDPIVYFLIDTAWNAVKIGTTVDIRTRITFLNVARPYVIEVGLLIQGGMGLEKEFHHLFSPYHIRGEWFHLSTPLKEYIRSRKLNDHIDPRLHNLKPALDI